MKGLLIGTIAGSITALMLQVIFLSGIAEAEELYTKSAEMICADTKVRVVTECYDDTDYTPPLCSKQQFQFTDNNTNKTITTPSAGRFSEEFNELATSWACIKGRSQYYLLVRYNNGGNCSDCEWFEIVDLHGKKLASDRGKTSGNANKHFKNIYKKIGLPQSWPRSSFVRIPLARKDRGE